MSSFARPLGVLAWILACAAIPARAFAEECRFPAPPTVVLDDGKVLLQSWEVDDGPVWLSELMPDSTAYWRFVQYVRARFDVSEPNRYLHAPAPSENETPDGKNRLLALSGRVGNLKPINCLEALLFSKQAERLPMETRPTEFLAFVFRRTENDRARLRIVSYTVYQPGIGRIGPLSKHAEEDAAAGWTPYLNLHDHNFFFDKTPVVVAMPWPSANDVQLMKGLSYGGRQFEITAVTNGFHTSHLRPEQLREFKGADGK